MTLRGGTLIGGALAFTALGAAGYWGIDQLSRGASPHMPAPAVMADAERMAPAAAVAPAAGFVTLTPEMVGRAGIETAVARSRVISRTWRSPGTVAPNAYRLTPLTSLAAGVVKAVHVQLGDAVRKGQTLVDVSSEALSDAERSRASARAELAAARLRRERSEHLAEIGGVSRQEVDDARAAEERQVQAVRDAETRAALLGPVLAPADGIVTERFVNAGQVVATGERLLTVASVSDVWVIVDVYERDVAALRVGAPAVVTSRAFPGEIFHGRVAYLEPQIAEGTRTLRARVEVPNRARQLRFGMLVDVELAAVPVTAVLVPAESVQQLGDRTVVFVPDAVTPGVYSARDIEAGAKVADAVEVRSGLREGETVVTAGSFALRAEWQRVGQSR
jgi:cobalt-zinc-cadmium efflux system membrane fusion protein